MAWKWNLLKDLAAAMLATGSSDEEVAKKAGVTARTLQNWKKVPEFKAQCEEIRERAAESVQGETIADLQWRVKQMGLRHAAVRQVIEERGVIYSQRHPDEPGITTGLVVPVPKTIAGKEVTVLEIDDAPLRELRELEKAAAVQLGQLGKDDDGKGPTYVIELD
jgi:hypothetical protein